MSQVHQMLMQCFDGTSILPILSHGIPYKVPVISRPPLFRRSTTNGLELDSPCTDSTTCGMKLFTRLCPFELMPKCWPRNSRLFSRMSFRRLSDYWNNPYRGQSPLELLRCCWTNHGCD